MWNGISKEDEKLCRLIIDFILNNLCTLRQCAEENDLDKDLIYHTIVRKIKRYYPQDYKKLSIVFEYNKLHRFKRRRLWDSDLSDLRKEVQ